MECLPRGRKRLRKKSALMWNVISCYGSLALLNPCINQTEALPENLDDAKIQIALINVENKNVNRHWKNNMVSFLRRWVTSVNSHGMIWWKFFWKAKALHLTLHSANSNRWLYGSSQTIEAWQTIFLESFCANRNKWEIAEVTSVTTWTAVNVL